MEKYGIKKIRFFNSDETEPFMELDGMDDDILPMDVPEAVDGDLLKDFFEGENAERKNAARIAVNFAKDAAEDVLEDAGYAGQLIQQALERMEKALCRIAKVHDNDSASNALDRTFDYFADSARDMQYAAQEVSDTIDTLVSVVDAFCRAVYIDAAGADVDAAAVLDSKTVKFCLDDEGEKE